MVKWITFILAAIGLSAGIYTIATANQPLPKPPPAAPPSVNPFPRGVAALGTVEPASREVSVVAPEQGMVIDVFVSPNQLVEKGQPLFQLDRRPLESQRVDAEASLQVAKAQLERLRSSPRAEDLPPLEANVAQAKALVEDAKDMLARTNTAVSGGGANDSEVVRKTWILRAAEARLATAEAELAKTMAGAWKSDLDVAESQMKQAEARIKSLDLLLERLTVRAPLTGQVLKRNIEPGEFAMASPMQMNQAAIVLGDLSKLHVRAQVDEEDVPQVRAGSKAVGRLRGASSREFSLKMLRIEPLALPKTNILGTPTERVDTRVIEIVFEVEGINGQTQDGGIYPGQAVDVFIESAPDASNLR